MDANARNTEPQNKVLFSRTGRTKGSRPWNRIGYKQNDGRAS